MTGTGMRSGRASAGDGRHLVPAPGDGRHLVLVSDAWAPQVNGVVRTLQTTAAILESRGWTVTPVTPDRFRSFPCPTYGEIRLAVPPPGRVAAMIDAADAVHIATEGPLGLMARRHCLRNKRPFTTSFHTRFPDYLHARFRLPRRWSWAFLSRFHKPAAAVLVATPRLADELESHGIRQTRAWSRGVDLSQFRPGLPAPDAYADLPRPILLSVGRVAVEKNIEAFLAADCAGSKVVVGDGPALAELRQRHPDVHFLGALTGEALARAYSAADLFVFPSRTDTFGLVIIEALASGLPVAAYPVAGPLDILDDSAGAMDESLCAAIQRALAIPRSAALHLGRSYGWEAAATQFETAIRSCALVEPQAEKGLTGLLAGAA